MVIVDMVRLLTEVPLDDALQHISHLLHSDDALDERTAIPAEVVPKSNLIRAVFEQLDSGGRDWLSSLIYCNQPRIRKWGIHHPRCGSYTRQHLHPQPNDTTYKLCSTYPGSSSPDNKKWRIGSVLWMFLWREKTESWRHPIHIHKVHPHRQAYAFHFTPPSMSEVKNRQMSGNWSRADLWRQQRKGAGIWSHR